MLKHLVLELRDTEIIELKRHEECLARLHLANRHKHRNVRLFWEALQDVKISRVKK